MKRGNFNGSNFLDPLTYPITDPPLLNPAMVPTASTCKKKKKTRNMRAESNLASSAAIGRRRRLAHRGGVNQNIP